MTEQSEDKLTAAARCASARLEARGASALVRLDDEALFEWLGSFSSSTADHAQTFENLKRGVAPADGSLQTGVQIFSKWSCTLHDLLCEPGTIDKNLRHEMLQAIRRKVRGSVEIVGGVLVAAFGLSMPVAGIVAALAIKLIPAEAVDKIGASRCLVPESHDAKLSRQAEEAL